MGVNRMISVDLHCVSGFLWLLFAINSPVSDGFRPLTGFCDHFFVHFEKVLVASAYFLRLFGVLSHEVTAHCCY